MESVVRAACEDVDGDDFDDWFCCWEMGRRCVSMVWLVWSGLTCMNH